MISEYEGQRFFVMHLTDKDRPSPDRPFEIQLLDADGRAASTGYVGLDETTLVLDGMIVPKPVVDAARRQQLGHGDYINVDGETVAPF